MLCCLAILPLPPLQAVMNRRSVTARRTARRRCEPRVAPRQRLPAGDALRVLLSWRLRAAWPAANARMRQELPAKRPLLARTPAHLRECCDRLRRRPAHKAHGHQSCTGPRQHLRRSPTQSGPGLPEAQSAPQPGRPSRLTPPPKSRADERLAFFGSKKMLKRSVEPISAKAYHRLTAFSRRSLPALPRGIHAPPGRGRCPADPLASMLCTVAGALRIRFWVARRVLITGICGSGPSSSGNSQSRSCAT